MATNVKDPVIISNTVHEHVLLLTREGLVRKEEKSLLDEAERAETDAYVIRASACNGEEVA